MAWEGLSGIWYQATTAATMLGEPSTRNSSLQAAIGMCSPAFVISQARLLAKLVAKGAAEMNRPVRSANSSLLKKNESRKGMPGEKAASPTPRAARKTTMSQNELTTDWRQAITLHDAMHRDM